MSEFKLRTGENTLLVLRRRKWFFFFYAFMLFDVIFQYSQPYRPGPLSPGMALYDRMAYRQAEADAHMFTIFVMASLPTLLLTPVFIAWSIGYLRTKVVVTDQRVWAATGVWKRKIFESELSDLVAVDTGKVVPSLIGDFSDGWLTLTSDNDHIVLEKIARPGRIREYIAKVS